MDLSTEELVVASFFLGKTQTMEFQIMQSMLKDMMNGK
jgi:stress-induced morphogen